MHFRPILLLHCPRPLPLCTPEWHQDCTPCQSSADLHRSCAWGRVIRPSAQGGLDLKKVLPFLFMVIKFGSTCLQSERMFWVKDWAFCFMFIFYLFQMLTSSYTERSQREVLINEPDWEDGLSVTRVYHTAIKWLSEPQCVRVFVSATSWKWRSIGSSSDF